MFGSTAFPEKKTGKMMALTWQADFDILMLFYSAFGVETHHQIYPILQTSVERFIDSMSILLLHKFLCQSQGYDYR